MVMLHFHGGFFSWISCYNGSSCMVFHPTMMLHFSGYVALSQGSLFRISCHNESSWMVAHHDMMLHFSGYFAPSWGLYSWISCHKKEAAAWSLMTWCFILVVFCTFMGSFIMNILSQYKQLLPLYCFRMKNHSAASIVTRNSWKETLWTCIIIINRVKQPATLSWLTPIQLLAWWQEIQEYSPFESTTW